MRNLLTGRRRRLVAALVVLALAGAGVAIAQWLTSGSGTGTGKVGTLQALTFADATFAGVEAFPGSPGDLRTTVTNPNPAQVTITSVSPNPSGNVNGWTGEDVTDGTCNGAYASATGTGLSVVVPPGVSTITIPGVVVLAANTPTACQGHLLRLWLTASATT